MPNWCCPWFDALVEHLKDGDAGVAIVACKKGDCRRFVLHNALYSNAQLMVIQKHNMPLPITLSTNMVISFCPHCGADIGVLIEQRLNDFDVLAASHEGYASLA